MSAPYTEKQIIEFIKEGYVEPFYQPIRITSDKGKYTKFEVLARIKSDHIDEISPYFFINSSKTANIYHLITEQIVCKSFKKIAILKKENPEKNLKFAINIQIDDIKKVETVKLIKEQLIEFKLASNIIFELSEEDALTDDDGDETRKFMKIFKDMGCEFALDDFGTGYSSFHPLLEFDFDYIKFDQILIEGLYKKPKNYYICDMLVEFSNRVGLRTIAEYVEDEKHEQALEAIGIEFYQGFNYTKAVQDVENWI